MFPIVSFSSCGCPAGYYETFPYNGNFGVWTNTYDSYAVGTPDVCGGVTTIDSNTVYFTLYQLRGDPFTEAGHDYQSQYRWRMLTTCSKTEPVCPDDQVFNPDTASCSAPPPPPCPEGQHNTETDTELPPICVCDNNLPKYLNDNGDMVCQVAQCPIDYNGKTLRQQNQTYLECYSAFPTSLYETEFVSDIGITCCFATGKNDNNSTPAVPSCPEGLKLNDVGECIEDIPDPEPGECGEGQEWDNFNQTCKDIPNASSPSDGDGGSTSDGGTDYNETSSPYTGGSNGAGGEGTENVVLEYNAGEVNDILEGYGSGATSVFNDTLNSLTPDLKSLYKISIPTMPNCGCSDIDYSMSLLGHSYTGVAEICNPLETLLSFLRPLLWFFFLIGMLFSFFRGGE